MNIDDLKVRLGRVYDPDDRDKGFPMRAMLPTEMPGIDYKYWWPSGWWGDQGNTPKCVAYSWTHWLAAGPITQKQRRKGGKAPFDPDYIYKIAQQIDEWPGENYAGTSVRAGAKVLKSNGFIGKYSWAWDVDTMVQSLLTLGPVVVGTTWKHDMFFPNKNGIITATGKGMGGHAYLLDGVNVKKRMLRIKNSWGRDWGKNGFAYISFYDMEKLIDDHGEICLATEIEA